MRRGFYVCLGQRAQKRISDVEILQGVLVALLWQPEVLTFEFLALKLCQLVCIGEFGLTVLFAPRKLLGYTIPIFICILLAIKLRSLLRIVFCYEKIVSLLVWANIVEFLNFGLFSLAVSGKLDFVLTSILVVVHLEQKRVVRGEALLWSRLYSLIFPQRSLISFTRIRNFRSARKWSPWIILAAWSSVSLICTLSLFFRCWEISQTALGLAQRCLF